VGELAAEIAANLGFLTSALRNVPERHRSMQAVFDYTWGRLADQEREIFAKLSVFRGGVRRQAAEEVAGASAMALASLVDKSLLQPTSAGRYEIHEMLRRYAADKLAQSVETNAWTQDQHTQYYAGLLHAGAVDLCGETQRAAAQAIGDEIDNIRAAWRWAVARQELATIEQAVHGLFLFYEIQSWYQEGDETFGSAAAALEPPRHNPKPDDQREAVLGQVLARQGVCARWLGQYDKARAVLERALAIARRHDAPREIGFCLIHLGFTRREQGATSAAEQLVLEGLALARAADDHWAVMTALIDLGLIARDLGQYEAARQYAQECLDRCTALGYPQGIIFATSVLGFIAFDLEDYAEAQRLFDQVLSVSQANSYPVGIATAWHYLGAATYFQGAYAEANELLHMALERSTEIGYQRGAIRTLTWLGDVAEALGDHQEALRRYSMALERSTEIGYQHGAIRALTKLGDLAFALGDHQEALQRYCAALQRSHTEQGLSWVVEALVGTAAIAARQQPPARAVELLTVALRHLDRATDKKTRDQAERLVAELAAQLSPQELAAAQERARESTLDAVVATLLVDGPCADAGVAPA
jgi:tetratricopeptide (TPR) repeat protein